MSLKSVMLQLRDEQLLQLDAEAQRLGISRSQLVRECVDHSFSSRFDTDVAAAYERAYNRSTTDIDEWGSLDAWHAAAASERTAPTRDEW